MIRLILALVLPWVTGLIWTRFIWTDNVPVILTAKLGYGYFFGLLLTALVMVVFDWLGLPQNYWATLAALCVLATWGYGLQRILYPRLFSTAPLPLPAIRWSRPNWRQVLATLLLLLLAIRFSTFFLEIIWRPLYPWDAFSAWALPARTWIDHGTLVQVNTKHPQLIPLFQFWPALALGYWDESLINLPWFLCALALVLAVYGQSRALGASPFFALLLCYLLISMPYLGVHILLAGYADVWLGTFYALAVLAFIRWVWERDYRQAALALVMALILPFIKKPGICWAASFIPAIFLWVFPRRWLAVAVVLFSGWLIAWYATTGIELNLPVIGRIFISPTQIILPGYEGEGLQLFPVWDAFVQNFFQLANWHLAWYLAPLGVLWATAYAWRDRAVAIALAPAFTSLVCLFFIFFFTKEYSSWAMDYTGLNRSFLHLVPAVIVSLAAVLIRHQTRILSSAPGDT